MKRNVLILTALITAAVFALSGCSFSSIIDGGSDAPSEEEAAPPAEAEETPDTSEPDDDPVPDSYSITLIPEDTNYDAPDIEEEPEPEEEIEPEDAESGLIVASDINPENADAEGPEVDDLIGREGNWATARTGVNVRSAPQGGEVIGSIEQGTQIKIIGVEGNWYVIDYEGQQAYVYNEFFE